jgi:hypothetical protein
MPTNQVAVEFVRFVFQNLPPDAEFRAIYDAMSRAAAGRKFRDLGHNELAQMGISFSLLATGDLEHLIEQARQTIPPEAAM